jgi:hypothetical protein
MRRREKSPEKPPKAEEYLVAYDLPADATRRRTFYNQLGRLAGKYIKYTRSVVLTFDKSTADGIASLVRTHGGAYAVFQVSRVEESWKP